MLVVFAAQTTVIGRWRTRTINGLRRATSSRNCMNVASTAFIAAGIEDVDVDVPVAPFSVRPSRSFPACTC